MAEKAAGSRLDLPLPGDVLIRLDPLGVGTGATGSRRTSVAARMRSSTAGSTWCTDIHRTIPKASRSDRRKLILYGCGDFINDYEGISGNEEYRGDLALMYIPLA